MTAGPVPVRGERAVLLATALALALIIVDLVPTWRTVPGEPGIDFSHYWGVSHLRAAQAPFSHGGVHEAAIGIGIFTGPAVGAASLYALPQFPRAATWAVSALLVAGLIGSLAIARSCRRLAAAAKD